MKKLIYYSFAIAAGVILLESFVPLKVTRRDGSDPGYTGSPGDGNKSCTTCHGGIATPKDGWITSDIPEDGYIPGQTYTIKATNTVMGSTRFGFEVSPQKINGDMMGMIIITDTLRTKLVGDNKYITYRADGVDGVDSNSWVFDWVAPQAGSGEVVFYGAFNANPGHKGADGTTLSTLKVKEAGSATGLAILSDRVSNLAVFPNPANDMVKIDFDLKKPSHVTVNISDINGKRLIQVLKGKHSGNIRKEINVSELPQGIYLINIEVDGKSATQKINVVH
jgi:hypothetical protein